MGAKFQTTPAGRIDVFRFDPADLILDPTLRGRRYSPSVEVLAKSIQDLGQLEPVGIRKDVQGRAVVVYGFTRVQAILTLKAQQPDIGWTVLCKLVQGNDELGYKMALAENMDRNELSQVDLAWAVLTWQNKFHKTPDEISVLMHRSTSWVSRMERIASLPSDAQQEIHEGTMAVDAALLLAGAPTEERKALTEAAGVIAGAKAAENGKKAVVTKKTVAEAVRQQTPAVVPESLGQAPAPVATTKAGAVMERLAAKIPPVQQEKPPAPKKPSIAVPRTLAEINRAYKNNMNAVGVQSRKATLYRDLLDFSSGGITAEELDLAVNTALGIKN